MKINWKVRFKNPVWWAEVAAALILPMLAAVGISWEQVTSWAALWDVIRAAFANPATIAAVIVSVWNTVIDPTTRGICDSARALCYDKPHCGEADEN